MNFQEIVIIEGQSRDYKLVEMSDTYACLTEDGQKKEFIRLPQLENAFRNGDMEGTFLAYRCNQHGPKGWEIQCILPDGKDYFNVEIDVERIHEGVIRLNFHRLKFNEQENGYKYIGHVKENTIRNIKQAFPMLEDGILHYLESQPQYRLYMATQSMNILWNG